MEQQVYVKTAPRSLAPPEGSINSARDQDEIRHRLHRFPSLTDDQIQTLAETLDPVQVDQIDDADLVALAGGTLPGLPLNPAGGLPLGLPGAQQPTRYVGATTMGAPTTGTFRAGDFAIAQDGYVWICTFHGSPGTWVQNGVGFSDLHPEDFGAVGNGITDDTAAFQAMRDAAMASRITDPDASAGFKLITRTMRLRSGHRYLITQPGALMDGARGSESGVFGYRLVGDPESSRIIYTPATAGPLFRNLDRFLFPHISGVQFVGGNSSAVCVRSNSAGTAQGWTWRDCIWWGSWNECFQLGASGGTANGNDSWAFERCRWKGGYAASIFHSGMDAGITGQDQAIAHEWTDCNIEPADGLGDSIFRFDYGGSAVINGGSQIINTGSGTVYSMPDSGTHFTGTCKLQVNGTRFEFRSSTAKLIDCRWQFGSVEFSNVSTDGHTITAGQILATFDGSGNTGPIVRWNGCVLNGRHEYKYRDNKYLAGISRAVYDGCTVTDYADMQNFLVHTQTAGTGQIGARWLVSLRDCRGGGTYGSTAIGRSYDVEANWQTTLGAIASPRWKSLKTPYGVLPFNATTGTAAQTMTLPLGCILVGVHFNMPAKPGGSAATSWSYVLTNGASTISYSCAPGTAWNLGFDVHFWNQYLPLNSDTQRSLTLTATGVVDSNVSGVCLVEYLPGS